LESVPVFQRSNSLYPDYQEITRDNLQQKRCGAVVRNSGTDLETTALHFHEFPIILSPGISRMVSGMAHSFLSYNILKAGLVMWAVVFQCDFRGLAGSVKSD
jgi:hypothetical protein